MDSLERVAVRSQSHGRVGTVVEQVRTSVATTGPVGRPDALRVLVEAEIVPRLMGSRGARSARARPGPSPVPPPSPLVDADDVARFTTLSLNSDIGGATKFVEDRCRLGIPLDVLYLDLLSPAARSLGEMWERDMCSFADVTVGLGVVQGVLHAMSPRFVEGADVADPRRTVLLLGTPGEQHTVGVNMVAEFFRRAHWDVRVEHPESPAACGELAGEQWYGVVGVSVGSSVKLEGLRACIRSIRRASINRDVAVLVGGPLFVSHPEFAVAAEADGTAADGSQVPHLAEQFVARMPQRV